jgi:crossover junction endodeoxyribonuclease RusA
MKFTLPIPPSVNRRQTISRNGRYLVDTKVYREWKADAVTLIQNAMAQSEPVDCTAKFIFTLIIHFADKRTSDLDNRVKAFQDAVTEAGLWEDDSQVDYFSVRRGEVSPRNGYIEADIQALIE